MELAINGITITYSALPARHKAIIRVSHMRVKTMLKTRERGAVFSCNEDAECGRRSVALDRSC